MTFQLQDFTKIEKIGEGTYGVVYKCKNKITHELVAIKKIRSDNDEDGVSSTTLREISMLKELVHPYIVKLHQTLTDKGKLYLLFEYLDMDLRKFLDCKENIMSPWLLQRFSYQLMQGLLFCHTKRIMHRDLKPQNLLVDITRNVIKLADFGLARTYGAPVKPLTHEVVTLWYRAPEILLSIKRYSCAIDVWSVACIIAEMATNKPLFVGDSEIDQLFSIFKILGTPDDKVWPGLDKLPGWNPMFPHWHYKLRNHLKDTINDQGADMLDKMLSYYPPHRMNIRDALCHKYFADIDKSDMPAFDEEKLSCPKETHQFYLAGDEIINSLSDSTNLH